jgi:hypothetical protein
VLGPFFLIYERIELNKQRDDFIEILRKSKREKIIGKYLSSRISPS